MKNIIQFLKFTFASIVSTVVDLSVFTFISGVVFNYVSWLSVFIATAIARVLATLLNYIISKCFVFTNIKTNRLLQYFVVASLKMFASWILVYLLYQLIHINESIIKAPVDILLFFTGYLLQKKWVFKEKQIK